MNGAFAGGALALASGATWAADKVTSSGPDWQGLAALVTAAGGIIIALLSAWLQYLGKKGSEDTVDKELIKELLDQLIEAKTAETDPEPVKKPAKKAVAKKAVRRRKPPEDT